MTDLIDEKTADDLDAAIADATKPKRPSRGAGGANGSGGTKQMKRKTKRDQLIALLRRKGGVDAPTISEAFGWRPHSTRAALSGLRKAGHEIEKAAPKDGGPVR